MATRLHRRRGVQHLHLEALEDRTLLSTFTVDRLTDTGDGSGMTGDLRYCITQATSGRDTINFSVTGTIKLSKALPVLASSVNLNGPGADLLTVRRDTGGFYRIFTVAPGTTVGISGLTIANGVAPLVTGLGGGVYNDGALTITSSILTGNSAADSGAGIYNSSSGTLTIDHSTFASNGEANDGGALTNGGSLTVSNSTFSGNKADDNGGGILNLAGPLTISDSTFSGNFASIAFGSALCVFGGSLTMSNSTVSGGKTTGGAGAIYIRSATAMLSNCTISANSSGSGGSIMNSGTLTVSSSTITGNMSAGIQAAGGISNSGNLTLNSSTISGNTAIGPLAVGGIINSGTLLINTCTISGNMSTSVPTPPLGAAGGIANSGTLTVTSSTISGNTGSGPQTAGGVVNGAGAADAVVLLLSTTVADNTVSGTDRTASQLFSGHTGAGNGKAMTELRNTVVTGDGGKPNFLADVGGLFTSDGHNLSSDDSGGSLTGAGDLINVNPLLGLLQDNGGPTLTMALLPGSPAIDAGDNTSPPATDQRGFAGLVNGVVDIGAFESRGFTLVVDSGDNQQAIVNTTFAASLRVSISSPFGEPVQGGQVTFIAPSSGASASFPAGNTATIDTTGRAGVAVASNTSAGSYSVTASASGSSPVHFSLTNLADIMLNPASLPHATAGVAYTQTLTASGGAGGPFSFAVTAGTLPPGLALSSSGVLSGSMTTAATSTFTITATGAGGLSASQAYTFTIDPGAAAMFLVTGFPSPVTAGVAGTVTITAEDAFGNVAISYSGMIAFSSSDPQAMLPANASLTAGSGTFSATLYTAGMQSLNVSDTVNPSLNGSLTLEVTPPVFLVTTTADSGAGSFRQAILDADATPGPDLIHFAIGTGVQTIILLSPLPAVTQSVVIDGTTQPGYAGVPLIELNGTDAGPEADGLLITAGGSVVRGLVINRFSLNGIELQNGGGNLVQGNYVGTDVTGMLARGNGTGVLITSSDNALGGTASGTGNVIAGNLGDGVFISNGMTNVVQGNLIGTDASGTRNVGNGSNGVHLFHAMGTAIGGTADGAGNLIAYNGKDGVQVNNGSGNAIEHNVIQSHSNGLGIELVNGGNTQLAFPVLTGAMSDGSTTTVAGLLMSTPNTVFTLEFFANSAPNPSGFGEGEQFLGASTLTTNGHGTATFVVSIAGGVAPGEFIAATATDSGNNTSAFSNCVGVPEAAPPPGRARGTRRPGLDETGIQGPPSALDSLPPPGLSVTRPPIPPEASPPLPERRVLDVLFGKRTPTMPRWDLALTSWQGELVIFRF